MSHVKVSPLTVNCSALVHTTVKYIADHKSEDAMYTVEPHTRQGVLSVCQNVTASSAFLFCHWRLRVSCMVRLIASCLSINTITSIKWISKYDYVQLSNQLVVHGYVWLPSRASPVWVSTSVPGWTFSPQYFVEHFCFSFSISNVDKMSRWVSEVSTFSP